MLLILTGIGDHGITLHDSSMTRGFRVTGQPPELEEISNRRKASQDELTRSLEREFNLLAEERRERAQRLGLERGLIAPNADK
jgi:hypothetical protein